MENEKKQKLVIDGNAFYEVDLDCIEEKKRKQKKNLQIYSRKPLPEERRQNINNDR